MDKAKLPSIGAGVAMVGLLVLAPFFLASGLVAPLWAVVVLCVIWVALFVTGILWFKRHPLWTLTLPVVAVIVWFAGVSAGESLLGWTA